MAKCGSCNGAGKVSHKDGGDNKKIPGKSHIANDRGISRSSVCQDCGGSGEKK